MSDDELLDELLNSDIDEEMKKLIRALFGKDTTTRATKGARDMLRGLLSSKMVSAGEIGLNPLWDWRTGVWSEKPRQPKKSDSILAQQVLNIIADYFGESEQD
jgi:hypothetical protein